MVTEKRIRAWYVVEGKDKEWLYRKNGWDGPSVKRLLRENKEMQLIAVAREGSSERERIYVFEDQSKYLGN